MKKPLLKSLSNFSGGLIIQLGEDWIIINKCTEKSIEGLFTFLRGYLKNRPPRKEINRSS